MDCLSPDLLAAWMDGTLSAEERGAAEAHASDCAHCQAMLAAMARTAPAHPQPGAWWRTPAVRWVVPVTAAAAVVLTVLSVGRDSRRPTEHVSTVAERTGPSAPPKARTDAGPVVPETATAAESRRDAADNVPQTRDLAAPRPGGAAGAVAGGAGADRLDALMAQKTAPAPPPGAPPSLPDSSSGVAGLPAGSTAPSTGVPAAPLSTAAAAESVPPSAPLPVQEAVTITGGTPAAGSVQKNVARVATRAPVEVISPERAYRWRTMEPGSVMFSIDGGLNWRGSSTGTSVALRAGSAPSRQVCWFVGQLGTVLLTTDGTNWQLRPFPERVDLTAVNATDARSAVVTTANRRRFATSDGGATWSPLQEH